MEYVVAVRTLGFPVLANLLGSGQVGPQELIGGASNNNRLQKKGRYEKMWLKGRFKKKKRDAAPTVMTLRDTIVLATRTTN